MMDPFRNPALQSAKLRAILESSSASTSSSSSTHRAEEHTPTSFEDMPAPPAYHMVVDPAMPIPNVRSPYDPEEDIEEEAKEEDDDTPEVTINAATQIRGHGNIISIAQMDSVRIANLITSLLSGEKTTTPDGACPLPTPVSASAVSPEHTSRTEVRGVKKFPNINITVNCGATIIGDRNIVGPGLGDIARQMQMAQRNQALLAQQQAAAAAANGQKMPSPPMQRRDTLYQAQAALAQQHHGVPSPPMSRSSSLGSEAACAKRKADGDCAESAKRRC